VTTAFAEWMRGLETRHLADLQFAEVTRALRALSSVYVERRGRLQGGAALSGAGKRAAFALFYGPLHYLLLQAIVEQIPDGKAVAGPLIDLGCGTGAAGAAWSGACRQPPAIVGIDRHPWAVHETALSYRELGLTGRARLGDITRGALPNGRAYLAAFALNELTPGARAEVLARLFDRAAEGSALLVVEPVSKQAAPWWSAATAPFVKAGGQADEWRFQARLPPIVEKLDRAAGLNHRTITARSLWMRPA
jgi:hypothetical protein